MRLSILNIRKTPEDKFWEWFSAKSDEFYHLEKNQNQLLNDLSHRFQKFHKNLTFQFSKVKANGKKEFVISADGFKEIIPCVMKLVDKAPKFAKWDIVAFRPRHKDFNEIQLNLIKLAKDDIYFKEVNEGDKTGLKLYIKNYNESDNSYIAAAFILLDSTIGEYDVMTQIGSITFSVLSDNDKKNLKRLNELPELIDAKKSTTTDIN